jgi:glycosyltransferase involved in cell wall biosynthesis
MKPLIAVCIPVWNRSDIIAASLQSLSKGLAGVEAHIYIFDNGSEIETRNLVFNLSNPEHKLFKMFLPSNFGIPYVVNAFRSLISQNCDLVNLRKPDFVMLMDSDAYFTRPIYPLLDILNTDYGVSVVSGHDSFEHKHKDKRSYRVGAEDIHVKVKLNERMLCLMMRREEFEAFDSFPTYRTRDVDWEIFFWNRMSLAVRRRVLVAANWVLHLGQFDSTWNSQPVPASIDEIEKITSVLEREGLLIPQRKEAANRQRRELITEIDSHKVANLA